MTDSVRFLTAARAAESLGLTVKALRVLESHGLIEPGRTPAGWRAYGPDELARLHQVLALRRLGLGLRRIGELLRERDPDLKTTLALQEEALLREQVDVQQALRLVRRARARLAAGSSFSTDDLTQLIKETIMMTELTPTPELEKLIDRHYTPEQLTNLKARPFSAEDQARVTAAWEAIYQEADQLIAAGGTASSAEAVALGRRSRDLVREFTGGDPAIAASLDRVWSEAACRPEIQHAMPGSPEANAFLAEARVRLHDIETADADQER